MSERVRAPLTGGGKPAPPKKLPSLIAYADPRTFAPARPDAAAAAPSAAPAAAASAAAPPHRRLTSDVYHVADADSDPSTLPHAPQSSPTHHYVVQGTPVVAEDDEEAELALGD